jgi:hypothetical protein
MNCNKTYEKPAIISTESLEAKAVLCNKSTSACTTISS